VRSAALTGSAFFFKNCSASRLSEGVNSEFMGMNPSALSLIAEVKLANVEEDAAYVPVSIGESNCANKGREMEVTAFDRPRV
jgi:hypothetical protein